MRMRLVTSVRRPGPPRLVGEVERFWCLADAAVRTLRSDAPKLVDEYADGGPVRLSERPSLFS